MDGAMKQVELNLKRIIKTTTLLKRMIPGLRLFVFFGLVVYLVPLLALGCVQRPGQVKTASSGLLYREPCSIILESSYAAGDRIAEDLNRQNISPDLPILVASFVNIDNLIQSSTLGRIISEQISSRLAQHGYKIIEMKLRQESVFIKKNEGEFMLSRDLKDLGIAHDVHAVLVGTYAVSKYLVYVSARVVRTEDSAVLVGHDYELPHDEITASLLR